MAQPNHGHRRPGGETPRARAGNPRRRAGAGARLGARAGPSGPAAPLRTGGGAVRVDSVGHDEDLALLRAHEPVVRLTRGEYFVPVAVDAYVAHASLIRDRPAPLTSSQS